MSNEKINKLQSFLKKEDLDALAIVPGSNFFYLTGGNFHLLERPTVLLISKTGVFSVCSIETGLKSNCINSGS